MEVIYTAVVPEDLDIESVEQFQEYRRVQDLQIGPSSKVW